MMNLTPSRRDERLAEFDAAWIWAKTDHWLNETSGKDRPRRIQRALETSASKERDALRNLAASRAWQVCMNNLREKERMALIAWSQAVKRIRSGTGKYAESHRETASQKLDECRRASCWIHVCIKWSRRRRPKTHQMMSLMRGQSVGRKRAFELHRRQIDRRRRRQTNNPMHVGVDRSAVEFLRRKYLKDIPHQEALDLEGSLFSQAELLSDRIGLREFRCMPEIIQFNNLSYSTEPLIPLNSGAERLQPLRTVFAKDLPQGLK
jgi:hypothetical protein